MTKKVYLPSSQLIGDMIRLPTPNGYHVNYPAILATMGIAGKYSVFGTIETVENIAYLCTTQPDRVRIRAAGTVELISELYENAPGEEFVLKDGNGVFYYKVAPSLKVLNDYADSIASRE